MNQEKSEKSEQEDKAFLFEGNTNCDITCPYCRGEIIIRNGKAFTSKKFH